MVKGFIYNGKSTKNIIPSSELTLGTFNNSDSVTGHQRDNIIGDTTISRPIANEYGTQYQYDYNVLYHLHAQYRLRYSHHLILRLKVVFHSS